MNITILEQPAFEPVSLADCYSHLRLDPDQIGSPIELSHPDDAMLTAFIATARREAEKITRRSFVHQKLLLATGVQSHWYGFYSHTPWINAPYTLSCHANTGIPLLRPPVASVASVKYYDSANVLQTVDPSLYYLTDEVVPKLKFTQGLPVIFSQRSDAILIEYFAGYPIDGSPADRTACIANVPAEIKSAILLGVQLLYDTLAPDQRDRIERARQALLGGVQVYLQA